MKKPHLLLASMHHRFSRFNMRERFMISVFLAGLWLWLTTEWISSLGSTIEQDRISRSELESQQVWLEKEDSFDARMQQALQKMDASKTYSGNRLLGVMDQIARDAGLQTSIARPTSRAGKVFTEHVLIVPLVRVELKKLIDFENRIKSHYPYLGIDYLMVEPEPMNPELLRGEMRVTSFELNTVIP
jgi:hypothetical protein